MEMFGMESSHFMVVMIVAVSIGGSAYMTYLKTRSDEAKARQATGGEDLRREVADLKSRVKTLERIVTDNEHQLSKEIERL
ncbi:MAG: hypothetical protein CMK06_11255 [Ponticaulis sp.]|nr:hypothetical protein [Ponticaulis sp.]|tara:strand:- start:6269 stop:6511 length:243 start_codon:yes stop_codon:yes gene_type:complete